MALVINRIKRFENECFSTFFEDRHNMLQRCGQAVYAFGVTDALQLLVADDREHRRVQSYGKLHSPSHCVGERLVIV